MKYIRTKEGRIIDISNLELIPAQSQILSNGTITEFKSEPVIAEADTIEELGDWYVGIDTFGKAHFIEATIPFENVKLCFRGMEINMATLTSKGLLYVAKMNKDGELELI